MESPQPQQLLEVPVAPEENQLPTLPSASVAPVQRPSLSTIILAIILAVVMSLQCFIPAFFCIIPGTVLAIKVKLLPSIKESFTKKYNYIILRVISNLLCPRYY